MSSASLDKNDHFHETVATFGDRLQAAREAKGLTMAGMAEKLGVEEHHVEEWESDVDEPRGNHIQLLAGLLNVSLVWLISGESNGTSDVADTYQRPAGVNDALGEISQLVETLTGALDKLKELEKRLLEIE